MSMTSPVSLRFRLISPPTILPGGLWIRRMIDIEVMLLPQPLSPTMPSVCPRVSENVTPSTARTTPDSRKK